MVVLHWEIGREMVTKKNATERFDGARALYEGAEPSFRLLADVLGLTPSTIARRAKRDGWEAPVISSAAEAEARIARLMNGLMRELDAIGTNGGAAAIDKGRIDGLTARMRMLEKLADINDVRRDRPEEQEKTDAEIADILKRIDQRIVTLAREFAAGLAGTADQSTVGSEGSA